MLLMLLTAREGHQFLFPSDAIALKDSEPNRRYFMSKEKKEPIPWIGVRISTDYEARKWRATLKANLASQDTRQAIRKIYTQLLGREKLEGSRESAAKTMMNMLASFANSDLEKNAVVGAEAPDGEEEGFLDIIPPKQKRDETSDIKSKEDINKRLKSDLDEPSRNQIIELLWKYKDVMGKVLPGKFIVKLLEHTIALDTED